MSAQEWALDPWSDESRFVPVPSGMQRYRFPRLERMNAWYFGERPAFDPIEYAEVERRLYESPWLGRFYVSGVEWKVLRVLCEAEAAIVFWMRLKKFLEVP